MTSTPTILSPEQWCNNQCQHIGEEGMWPAAMLDEQLLQFSSWSVSFDAQGNGASLFKRYNFADFTGVMQATHLVNALAKQQDHHPLVTYSYNFLEVSWSTHSANGISNNDWVCAAKLDQALNNLG